MKSLPWKRLLRHPLTMVLGVIFIVIGIVLAYFIHFWSKIVAVHRVHDLAMAIREYHDKTGEHLPFVVRNEAGQPMYSWRAAIMPFVDPERKFSHFPDDFRFDEVWSSEANHTTIERWMSKVRFVSIWGDYRCCLAVHGDVKPWNLDRFPAYEDFDGKPAFAIVIIEAKNTDVLWSEPRDLYYDGNQLFLTDHDGIRQPFDPRGCQAVRYDGSPWMFPDEFDEYSLQDFMIGSPKIW